MAPEDSTSSIVLDPNVPSINYALRLGEGLEYAEFEPSLWRLTVFHVLGVSRQVSLGYAEVYLLDYFAKHPGEMLSRQELLDHAWGDRVVSQGSLNQAISNLRALLGDDQKREIILTVPRRGYQFNADALVDWQEWLVRKDEILTPALVEPLTQVKPVPVPSPSTPSIRRWHMPALLSGVGVLFLMLVAGLVTHSYYALFPPYVSEQVKMAKTQVTLLAQDIAKLEETRALLLPVLKRLDGLGGGRALINRSNNYLELHCFRADKTVHTLLVHIGRMQSLDDAYLQGCLK